ncbi:MAG: UDP-N-acetylmuramate dehydrogenase [Chloroflexi bacterium]|nr:UDP-N-acetylmuramate dehydrogenase [Chloroflexota bacterium]MCL5075647.1 UDP-N-acetylmuramate dehydrogenase [Chloroflexota bacterium]
MGQSTVLEKLRLICRDRLTINEPMRRHTSFGIGGPAEFYTVAESAAELGHLVTAARHLGLPYLVIGSGSNLLVSDKGISGLVIRNRARHFKRKINDDGEGVVLQVESGASLAAVTQQTARAGLAGLEFGAGIPGTMGGAIVNNAGAYDGCVGDALRRVSLLEPDGCIAQVPVEDLHLKYRSSRFRIDPFKQEVILSAEFILHSGDARMLCEKIRQQRLARLLMQPMEPSAGSIFKNPPGQAAARLIERAGLKGKRYGDAQISLKHANFIVNLGKATAQEVMSLIDICSEQVYKHFGVILELEVELVGEW